MIISFRSDSAIAMVLTSMNTTTKKWEFFGIMFARRKNKQINQTARKEGRQKWHK